MTAMILLFGCLLGADAAPVQDDLPAQVRKLVKELDGRTNAGRDAAEARLIGLGSKILDLLPDTNNGRLSAEAKERVERIRQQLQRDKATATTEASLVTLDCREMRLSKALATIQAQSGNAIDTRQAIATAGDSPVTLDVTRKPFWTVLDALLDQGRLSIYPFGRSDAIQLMARRAGQLPRSGRAALTGPFRIEPTRVVARRDLRQPGSILMVALELAWEPRIRPIALKQRMADIVAVDQDGKTLRVENPEAETEAFPRSDAIATEMDLVFPHPSHSTTEIASLKGVIRATLPGRIENFRFANLLDGGKQTLHVAAATVVLEEVRRSADNWEMHLRLRYDDAGDAMESHRTWAVLNKCYLEDAAGQRVGGDPVVEIADRAKDEIGLVCSFALKQPPTGLTLVYKAPASIVTKSFPYELHGIKLP
jgi:hypothetical protein